MKIKKRRIYFFILVMTITLLTACNNNNMDKVYNDNNKISSENDNFGLDDSKEDLESGVYKGSLKLSGSGTIWKYRSEKEFNLKLSCILHVKTEKAKIVLISPDNTVTTLIEKIDNGPTKGNTLHINIPIKKGMNRIKIIGYKKANMDVEVKTKKGEFEKISFN